MASNATPYASKGRRVAVQLESTPGTPDVTGPSTYLVPANDFSYSLDRGSGVIERSAVLDGFPGSICYTPGSRAASMSLTTEIHDSDLTAASAPDYYLSHLLLGCGFAAADGTDYTGAPDPQATIFFPSHEQITGATGIPLAGGEGPQSLTVYHYYEDASIAGSSYQNVFRGSTAGLSLNLGAGEIATAECSMVGTLETADWMATPADGGLPTSFDSSVSCKPYVVRSATITLTDSTGGAGNAAQVVTLSDLNISFNAETPENQDPTQEYGFGISPVLFPTAPTVSFTIGATEENNGFGAFSGFLQQFRDGTQGSLLVVLDTGDNTGSTLTISIDKLQYTGVTWGDANGYVTYSIEAVAVRDPGSATPSVVIETKRLP